MFLDLTFYKKYVSYITHLYLNNITMADNKLTYNDWKEYLKNDRDMNKRWNSLVSMWERTKKDLNESLDPMLKKEALNRKNELTARNIFNLLNTTKERLDFKRYKKSIYNEKDERHEYVIACRKESSDFIFKKLKEERWVANMQWESINKYLQPVADRIWALNQALKISVHTETKPSDLSYKKLKTKPDSKKDRSNDLFKDPNQLEIPFDYDD